MQFVCPVEGTLKLPLEIIYPILRNASVVNPNRGSLDTPEINIKYKSLFRQWVFPVYQTNYLRKTQERLDNLAEA